jgi:phage/plasmid-like protein (TIGR03299 family)
MAHELDTRANGTAAFVSLRQSAWHNLGTIMADEMSFDEAMDLGGLNYPLALRPMTTTSPILDANGQEIDTVDVEVPDFRAVVRTDRNGILGVVGGRYELVTNREAMGMVDVLVNEGLAVIETAGVLRGGADAWMAIRFTGDEIDAAGENGGDTVQYFGLVRTNHNGKAAVQVATTPIRVVCANTLAMALADGRSAIHRVAHFGSGVSLRVQDAARNLWGATVKDAVSMSAAFASMRQTTISESQFAAAVLDVIAPLPAVPSADASKLAHALHPTLTAKAEKVRFSIQQLWVSGTGQHGQMTAWDAYNAATEALDHFDAMPTKGERLVAMLPGGKVDAAKTSVFTNLLALSV